MTDGIAHRASNPTLAERRTTLYRFYDVADRLLYVGITGRHVVRWVQHSGDKQWWPEVSRVSVEHHPDRQSALDAERAAIQSESPAYNVVHSTNSVHDSIRRSAPTTTQQYEIAVGEVVVIRHRDRDAAPVGIVGWVGERGFKMTLYHWAISTFCLDSIFIRWDDVIEVLWAEYEMDGQSKVFQMDPLADAQRRWDRREPSMTPGTEMLVRSLFGGSAE